MPLPEGVFRFPGVAQIRSGDFTLSHGITPSEARIEIAPQVGLVTAIGELSIEFGSVRIAFPDCAVRAPSIRRSLDGMIFSFSIQDRRWRWRYQSVFGRYNIKRADGVVDELKSTRKSPQELAEILLKAMGEQGFDVSAMDNPADMLPTCIWDGHNPSEELAKLCDSVGCRVAIGTDNRVRIVKAGQGKDLPADSTRRTYGYGLTVTARPDKIQFLCGPTLFQSKLRLEAVGLDRDGRIKLLADLSYIPTTGADGATQKSFGSETLEGRSSFAGISNLQDRKFARMSVYRWYRVKSQADGTLTPPRFPEAVQYIRQLLPLRSFLAEYQLDAQRDTQGLLTQAPVPAYIEGVFNVNTWDYENPAATPTQDGAGNSTIGTRYAGGFSIDEERGIVMFGSPVVKNSSSGWDEAELYLTTSYTCRRLSDNLPCRTSVTRAIGAGDGTLVIPVDDVYERIRATHDGNDAKQFGTIKTNDTEVYGWANAVLDTEQQKFQQPTTEQGEWAGIRDISPDGAVQQVSWSVGPGGAITRASRNTEFDLVIPNHAARRREEMVRSLYGQTYRDLLLNIPAAQ